MVSCVRGVGRAGEERSLAVCRRLNGGREEEEEESLFKADAENEEDPERDRARRRSYS